MNLYIRCHYNGVPLYIRYVTKQSVFCLQYSRDRANTVTELQQKLADMGSHVGTRTLDLGVVRDKNFKRELKFLNLLVYIKTNMWKTWFGKEADKLEKANEDERTYYIIEKEPLVNKFIPVPKDAGIELVVVGTFHSSIPLTSRFGTSLIKKIMDDHWAHDNNEILQLKLTETV